MVHIRHNVFIVTGGGSGLGAACVADLVRRGAYVGLLDFDEEAGKKIELQFGGCVLFSQCDVRDEEGVQKALDEVKAKWPQKKLVGVVHCGGVGMAGKV